MAQDRKKMVVEGRSWWYTTEQSIIRTQQEFGITIGKEVKINGRTEPAREVMISLYTLPHLPEEEPVYVKDSLVLAYMIEDGNSVSILPANFDHSILSLGCYLVHANDAKGELFNLYNFGNIGDSFFYGFNGLNPDRFEIADIKPITNSGISYNLYETINPEVDRTEYTGSLDFIEGIGHPNRFNLQPLYGGCDSTLDWQYPQLTYVTDGDDNHVIYEALGGPKLWELAASVENICLDESNAPVEFFNLNGVRVDGDNLVPGVYIRRQGSVATKVVVK